MGDLFDHDAADNRLREPVAALFDRIPPSWRAVTDRFIRSAEGGALAAHIDGRIREGVVVYPRQVFRALEFGAPEAVRVVILGQDPYHGAGQAQGLAFSVTPGTRRLPPSLRNILLEVASDTGAPSICRDDLSPWARQGVLLLNSALTVEDGAPQSHATKGWATLTDALIAHVAERAEAAVFMLWGAAAQKKQALIDPPGLARHLTLLANHPSPLSARRPPTPFIGCRHFTRANAHLLAITSGRPVVQW